MTIRNFTASLALSLALSMTAALPASAETWKSDATHFSITFDVDHMGFSRYVMRFNEKDAMLDFSKDAPEKARITATIKAASYDSHDDVLKKSVIGEEVLNAVRYPDITFKTVNVKLTGDKTAEVVGDLTIKGVTKPVILQATFNGQAESPMEGVQRLGFSATGSFKRSTYGINNWVPFVGDEIKVRIEAEFTEVK